jgi:hypothetical protein
VLVSSIQLTYGARCWIFAAVKFITVLVARLLSSLSVVLMALEVLVHVALGFVNV